MFASSKFCFSNCVWNVRKSDVEVSRDAPYVDGGCIAIGAGESAKFTAKGEHPLTPRKLCDSVHSFRSAGKMEGARLVCFRQRPAGGLRPSLALQAFEKFCRHADKLFARQFLREKFRLPARRFKPEKFLADDRSVFGLELLGKGLRRIKGL